MGAVEREREEVFLLAVGVVANEGDDVGGKPDTVRAGAENPPGKLEGRGDQAALRGSEPGDEAQVLQVGPAGGLIEYREYLLGQAMHGFAARAGTQEYGQKLPVCEIRGAVGCQLLPWREGTIGLVKCPFAGGYSVHTP